MNELDSESLIVVVAADSHLGHIKIIVIAGSILMDMKKVESHLLVVRSWSKK